jgi:rubrerythrin
LFLVKKFRENAMGINFNADEVFALAENMEKNGAAFYRQAAMLDVDPDIKTKLRELAEMEDNHQEAFKAIRKQLATQEKTSTVFDPDNELSAYLDAMSAGYALAKEEDPQVLLAGKGLAEILKIAISLEKDAIVFYLGLKDLVPDAAGKDKVDWIIRQERGHVVTLSAQLRSIKT